MKKILSFLPLFLFVLYTNAQSIVVDRLKRELQTHPQEDTFRINRLVELCAAGPFNNADLERNANELISLSKKIGNARGEGYGYTYLASARTNTVGGADVTQLLDKADSIAKKTGDQELLTTALQKKSAFQNNTDAKAALATILQAEEIARSTGNKKLLARTQYLVAGLYDNSMADYPKAMEYLLKSISAAEEVACRECLANSWISMALLYTRIGDEPKALTFFQKAYDTNKQLGDKAVELGLLRNIGESYRLMGRYPEAINNYRQALAEQDDPFYIELCESNIADVYVRMDSLALAFEYALRSLAAAKKIDDLEGVAWIDGILSRAYLKNKKTDSALYYANNGLAAAKKTSSLEYMRDNAQALAEAYAHASDFRQAFDYHKQYIAYRDSMLNGEVTKKTALLEYGSDLEKKQAQITVLNQQKRLQKNFLISVSAVLLLIAVAAIALMRSNRQKRLALAELKQTQAQLVQSEKMASLGELTAGIAHEIQNPLNFVNNFSEVSEELISELKGELAAGNLQVVNDIAGDIEQNLEKINHHGKRADSIVKSMLLHSRKSTGEKESTDINALADEYLRLAYHGLRAKDKTFNVTMKTEFDNSIGKVKIIPQEIGRVLLNIYNNAFFAMNEKDKTGTNGYIPVLAISTKKVNGHVELRIKDNGTGMPQSIAGKIFQPFFTTKPTGVGTGLGLSLAYDTVKAHGGELKVETSENNGAVFIIQLPL